MSHSLFKSLSFAVVLGASGLFASQAFAAEDLVETTRQGCQTDIDSFCKDVTPGEGRVLACLGAHEDKLSARCTYSLFDANAQLERFAAAMAYVGVECKADLQKHCAGMEIGDGKLAKCLQANKATLAPACSQAMKDTELHVD
ncbi:cysteine rich repeat-containing protein [Dokdonella sp.]|uniref:cysteine rich repeat-containing protein n=1 Tax=Dokdonella sp. TaxID=2291710 RepID=UPI003C61F945